MSRCPRKASPASYNGRRRSIITGAHGEEVQQPALEADALHFQTDVWSSAVVIAGLACVKLGEWAPALGWLRAADAVAALGAVNPDFYPVGLLALPQSQPGATTWRATTRHSGTQIGMDVREAGSME